MMGAPHGQHMRAEAAEACGVFARAAVLPVQALPQKPRAIYTLARGSSDAAANILSYEMMRELAVPVTSLPPSVFSLGQGVALQDSLALVVSQSGASDDLVRSATGAEGAGAHVRAITNMAGSAVEQALPRGAVVPIGAGPEQAVPATKTVVGSVAAGMALLAAMKPTYAAKAEAAAKAIAPVNATLPDLGALQSALLRAGPVFVIGRDTGYGAAIEVALKLKECCAIHAEAYSSSEVLHGPLQLAVNPLLVLILDTGAVHIQDSLDQAEARLRSTGCTVFRLRPTDLGVPILTPAASAALLLAALYPVILDTALALGFDPDSPQTLSKVTQTL